VRGGVVGECRKELELSIFATLETSIKLAKGTVKSPATEVQIEQVSAAKREAHKRIFDYCYVLVTWPN
jgi:hypothetical protein